MTFSARRRRRRLSGHSYGAGVWVPSGALDRWYAARTVAGSATHLIEVVIYGDSTTFGAEGTGNQYSWVDRLRDRCKTAGYTDGGKGVFGSAESTMVGRDAAYEVNGQVSNTGFLGATVQYDNMGGQYFHSTTTSGTVVLQGYGSVFRLWYSKGNGTGDIGVVIDGGTETLVQGHKYGGLVGVPGANYGGFHTDFTGLNPAVLHTVTITNKGSATTVAPAGLTAFPSTTGGSLSSSTDYYYVTTAVTPSGETPPSSVATSTHNSVNTKNTLTLNPAASGSIPCPSSGSYKVYRSTSSLGPFRYLADVARGVNGLLSYVDDGSATPNAGINPPSVNTAGVDTDYNEALIAADFHFSTGVVWNKYATTGGTFNVMLHGGTAAYTTVHDAHRYQTPLGLLPTGTSSVPLSPTSADGFVAGNVVDTSYPAGQVPRPVLAILDLGFNDLTSQTTTDYSVYIQGINKFAAACRAASCGGIVIHGNLPVNAKWPTYGVAIFNAMKNTALAQGMAFVDFWQPFGGSLAYTGGTAQPHLLKSQYQQQADFLWDSLLGI